LCRTWEQHHEAAKVRHSDPVGVLERSKGTGRNHQEPGRSNVLPAEINPWSGFE